MFNALLESVKSAENLFDVDDRFFQESAHDRRSGRFQPNRIDFIDRHAITAGCQKRLGIPTISATDRFHTGTADTRCAQQMQKSRYNMGLSYARVRPGDEETHATCATRSDAPAE